MPALFENIRVCVFDAYGTLFDVHSATARYARRLGAHESAVSELWRTKQLQYTWLRSLMDAYEDFWTVTQHALDYSLASFGIRDEVLRDELMNAYLRLNCYEEVIDVLKALRAHGIKTAILSNGSPAMLESVVSYAGIAAHLDACLSVEEKKIYKPASAVYRMPCDLFGVEPAQISFQSSNCWDATGGANFGYQVAWCNRFKQPLDRLPGIPQAEIRNLRELLPIVGIG